MALGKVYAESLAKKAPPPDKLEALGGDDDEAMPDDEDGDQAAAMSAYEDFARLAGFKASPETFAAFKELVQLIR